MNFKNFLVISLILVSVFFLFGCTSSNCGDGICQSGEESFCYTDCGTILPSTTVSISVIDATSGKLINTNNNIFIELPDKDDLDCSNPFFNTLCEARYYLDSNPKKLETFSVLLGNVDSLLIGVGADGYKMTDVRLNISKDDSSDFTISLEPKDDLLVDLKEGDICEIDSQCYAGNNNYAVCAADIYGIKRCNVNTTINPELNLSSCILDASAFEIKKDKSVCLNETQKVTCTGVEWSKPIDCEGECRNGSCVSEVYSPKTKTFKFLKDVQYGLTLPVQPSSNSIREIFEELPAGSMVYKWIKNGDKSYWSSSTKGGRTGTFNPDNNLFAGEGFILKSSQDIDFKFSGDTIASTTYTISEKFTPIGIPTCPEEYTFSKIVKEVSAIEPLCNTVSLQNVGSSYPTWWSSDPSVELKGTKEDLQVLSYESIWIRCGDGVVLAEGEKVEFDSFEWSPSCSKKIATCETFGYDGGEVDCDSVNEEGECIIFNIDNCYKNGNFKEIYAVRAWDPIYEGSANYETYGPFYYKRMCNGLAENCVDSLLEFTSGDLKGTIIPIKGYGKDLNGNVFEMEGISWVELNTSLNFDASEYKSIDWNYKLYGPIKEQKLPVCGNGIVEGNEQCDGSAVYESCSELGFVAGTVGCNSDCTYNTTMCAPHLENCNETGKTCVITACEQLSEINNFREVVRGVETDNLSGNYILGNDIDCTNKSVPIIGFDRGIYTYTRPFNGTFDGNGYSIKGINIATNITYENSWADVRVGLFRELGTKANIKNLTLSDVNIIGAVHVGSLAGRGQGNIHNVKVTGTVKGGRQVGGLFGSVEQNGIILNHSSFDGNVTAKQNAGALIGNCITGTITSPKSIATVSPKSETKFIGDNDKCRVQYSLSYDAYLFNGANAPLKLRLDGNIAKTPYYDTNKLVTIHDANNDEVLVEFVHDFSREDLDLLPVTVSIMKNFQNKNILFINNLKVQDDKTMFLEKIRPVSKAVCVLNEEVEDVNQLIRECTKLSCPGDKIIGDSNVSCILDENKFTIFGLKYSGVIEEWECGDNWCDIDENSLSCPSDCNEFCGNNICGVGENTTNCSEDCKPAPSTGSSGGTSGGSSGWSTKPVTCTTNASCGEVSYVGEKYCDGSVVYQKAKIPTCINPSRTDSNCIIVEKDLNVMECSNSQTCKSGKCIENQVNYDSIACTTVLTCKDNEECLDGYCKEIVCQEGWTSREHECFCEGTHCTAKLLEDNGVVDSNLLNEETGTFDIIPILIGLFILLIIIIIIAALFWFFVIKKKKKEEIPTQ